MAGLFLDADRLGALVADTVLMGQDVDIAGSAVIEHDGDDAVVGGGAETACASTACADTADGSASCCRGGRLLIGLLGLPDHGRAAHGRTASTHIVAPGATMQFPGHPRGGRAHPNP